MVKAIDNYKMTYDEMKSLLLSIGDPILRLEALMDIGKDLVPIPSGMTGVEIKGCASRVEIWRDDSGKLYGTADSAIVRGVVAVLLAMKGANVPWDEFQKLDLNLGAARLNGAAAMTEYLSQI